jgi:bifunctional DNA-binding transcriptional regulator/antitoxin component of YhaV-PrlF toxin-antitoxin module
MPVTTASEARLRARNQLTLPDRVVQAAGIVEGDRFVVEIDANDPDVVRLHRIRSTYAGALADLYGDASAYLESERASWG